MGLRRKKHGDSCDCAICERERPKPTYISLDEDFYHLSTPIDAADFDAFGAECVADVTDLGLSLHDLLTYASVVANFVTEQGVRFCFPLGPPTSSRKRIELVKDTKMGLFTVGGALWRRIEGAGLDPRVILVSSEEKFNSSSLFSAHAVAGMFLWWKIWKKEQYAASEKKREMYVTVVSAGRASRRYVSLPVQHLPVVYGNTRLSITVGALSATLLPVETLSSAQQTLLERYYGQSAAGQFLSPTEDPHLAAGGYHASSFSWYRLGQRAVVDDYWAARYGKAALQPKVSSSRESLVVRNIPERQQSIDSGIEGARITDPARQRRPPEPPSRPSVSSLPETSEQRSRLDVAEAGIRLAETRALDEKARLRSQGVQHPKPRALSDVERDEDLRRELRRVEQEAWERHLEELRWQEKKSIEERRNFEEAYCRKSLGEASAMTQRQSSCNSASVRQNSYPDTALSPMASRQSCDARVPPWQETLPRNAPSRESYDSRLSHRRQDSLAAPSPESDLRQTNNQQGRQTQAGDTETQRLHDHRHRQVSFEQRPPSSSGGSQSSAHRTAPDMSKATLACLLLAHLLHNTGGENEQDDPSRGTPSSSRAPTQVEVTSPIHRTSIDSYRQCACDDPEAVDLEDGPFRTSPVQRNGTARLNRPGGPRDPRRPSGHRSSFSSSIAPSDSVSVVSGVDRESSRRAATPPTPVFDDPPESQLPPPSPPVSTARYAFESRTSLASAPPGYHSNMDVHQHHPAPPSVIPISPPPQYSISTSSDPTRPRKPTTMYHNHRPVSVLPRPDDHTTEDCNVQ
ncbi:hypothetical protein A1Q2_05608 [Trichosporon asahii var. asahii CBS 8904]|uniref:Uncharacterized protein n=1 Tax=Trichosporon asahii var. asahii (strain CBS 8904) TaxID=1220162 RepID=K1WER8_TRIAC|nr:hypothetical protein A1Q2_05608 [Trichosporon asahii var. asahii CBS 8904]